MDQQNRALTSYTVNPVEAYVQTHAQIQRARAQLDELDAQNKANLEQHKLQIESELLRKIREGENARRQLLQLNSNNLVGASSARLISMAQHPIVPTVESSQQSHSALDTNQQSIGSSQYGHLRPGSISSTSDQLRGNITSTNLHSMSNAGQSQAFTSLTSNSSQYTQPPQVLQHNTQVNVGQSYSQLVFHNTPQKMTGTLPSDNYAHTLGVQNITRQDVHQQLAQRVSIPNQYSSYSSSAHSFQRQNPLNIPNLLHQQRHDVSGSANQSTSQINNTSFIQGMTTKNVNGAQSQLHQLPAYPSRVTNHQPRPTHSESAEANRLPNASSSLGSYIGTPVGSYSTLANALGSLKSWTDPGDVSALKQNGNTSSLHTVTNGAPSREMGEMTVGTMQQTDSIPLPIGTPSNMSELHAGSESSSFSPTGLSSRVPATPTRPVPQPKAMTPASANRKTLAKDILKALGPPREIHSVKKGLPERNNSIPDKNVTSTSSVAVDETTMYTSQLVVPQYSTSQIENQNTIGSVVNDQANVADINMADNNTSSSPVGAFIEEISPSPKINGRLAAFSPRRNGVFHPLNTAVLASTSSTSYSHVDNPHQGAAADADASLGMLKKRDISSNRPKTPDDFAKPKRSPLFLPSSGESTPEPNLRVTDVKSAETNAKQRSMTNFAYVLVPPKPAWAIPQITIKTKGKKRLRDEDMGSNVRVRRRVDVELMTEASLTRLTRRECQWLYCTFVGNSGVALQHHVKDHVDQKRRAFGEHTCFWLDCSQQFRSSEAIRAHLEEHVRSNLSCPYAGCDEVLHSSESLLDHGIMKHAGGEMRREASWLHPEVRELPALPEILPAYMAFPCSVSRRAISKERHLKLGPWVYRNIFGPINLDPPRRQIRRYSDTQENETTERPPSNKSDVEDYGEQYDFLMSWSKSSAPCLDLASQDFSDEIDKGLMLWAGEPASNNDGEEDNDEADTDEKMSTESSRIVENTLDPMERIDQIDSASVSKTTSIN